MWKEDQVVIYIQSSKNLDFIVSVSADSSRVVLSLKEAIEGALNKSCKTPL